MKKIAIINGTIVDPIHQKETATNIYISDGKIIAIANSTPDNFKAEEIIDAKDKIVCPGFVDLHANILSDSSNEKFISNLEVAASAGFTHVAGSAFTETHCLEASEIKYLSELSQTSKKTKIFFIGALTQNLEGNRLNELMLLKEAGCIGFTNGYYPLKNTLIKKRCYDYAAMLGLKIYTLLEDPYLSKSGFVNEGEVSAHLGFEGLPSLSETLSLSQELLLIEETGLSLHLCRLSAGKTTHLLKSIDKKKINVSSDVAIHQLFLTEDDVELDNGYTHVRPPFRTKDDRKLLREALKADLIDAITSDHNFVPIQFKEIPFQESKTGIASWPLLLPLLLRLAKEENISLSKAISFVTSRPANILGIDAGHLKKDSSANIVIFDQDEAWKLSEDELTKFGTNNPFRKSEFKGRVKYTIVDGKVIYRDSN